MPDKHLRLHGHIHNNGYTRAAFVPFLRQHVNLSVEQTKYKPVNLALLLSAVIDGRMVETDPPSGPEDVEKASHHFDPGAAGARAVAKHGDAMLRLAA